MSYEYMTGMGFAARNPFNTTSDDVKTFDPSATTSAPATLTTTRDVTDAPIRLRSIKPSLAKRVISQTADAAVDVIDTATDVVDTATDAVDDIVETVTDTAQETISEPWIQKNWMYLLGGGLIVAGIGWFVYQNRK